MLRKHYKLLAACLIILMCGTGIYAQAGVLDYRLDPRYGGVDLNPSDQFPYEFSNIEVTGAIDASQLENCVGFTTEEPTLRVVWTQGNNSTLSFYFDSTEDTTIIINTAHGEWICNDDSDGFNPRVDIPNADDGQYDIWIGRYNSATSPEGTLSIVGGDENIVVTENLCPDLIRLSEFDPEVVDDNTVIVEYRNGEGQVFNINITGDGVGGERLQTILDETLLCLRATGPLVMPTAEAVDESSTPDVEEQDQSELVAFEISVVDIGELISEDYEVHFAVDPTPPRSYTLTSARSATVTSLCSTGGNTITARLYNPRFNASNPNQNVVYTLSDTSGGLCVAMKRSNGTTLYVTAKDIYVTGSTSGGYFTMTGTWGTKQ